MKNPRAALQRVLRPSRGEKRGRVQTDEPFLRVARYVERNALRAKLVRRAEQWQWSSLSRLVHANGKASDFLNEWPMERPQGWIEVVNGPEGQSELDTLRASTQRGRPFGSEDWVIRIAQQLKLESTMLRWPAKALIKDSRPLFSASASLRSYESGCS